jgi:hypothetical protein
VGKRCREPTLVLLFNGFGGGDSFCGFFDGGVDAIRGSQAEAPAPPITQVPVGVVDRKMTETLRIKAQGLKMDPYIASC